MHVYFVVLSEMLTGVVPSQVVAPARAYAAAIPELSVRIVFLEPARVAVSRPARERLAALRAFWPEGRMAVCPFVGRLGEFSPATSLGVYLRSSGARSGRFLLHCRGPEATIQGARAARALGGGRVVFDARGASGHEAVLRTAFRMSETGEGQLRAALDRGARLDRRAAETADAVVAVSEPLLRHVAGDLAASGKPAGVVPCCVERPLFAETARREVRAALGLDGEVLAVHTSTEARWEAFDQVVDLFRALRAKRSARLLFLTTLDAGVVTASLDAADPLRADIVVRSAAPKEVARYLSAADVGLLLRRPHDTHRMASPIKFAEYLGAGLAVAVSEGIGTTGEVVGRERLGVVVAAGAGPRALEDAAARLLDLLDEGDALRERAIRVCEERFLWERQVPLVSRIYGVA